MERGIQNVERHSLPGRADYEEEGGKRRCRILDAAEQLFARSGFDGVSLRQVAREADVDLALPSYHFKNKRGLFDAVLLRRAEQLNAWRLEALEECVNAAAPHAPKVEAVVSAFLKPMFCHEAVHEKGWRHYYELIACKPELMV